MLSSVFLILGLYTVVSAKSTIDDVEELFRNTIGKWGVEIQDEKDYLERYKRLVEAKKSVDLTSSGVVLDSLNRFSVNNDAEHAALLKMTETRSNRTMDLVSGQDDETLIKRGLFKRSDNEELPAEFDYWENEVGLSEVRDQFSCGGCGAFASVSALETMYKQLTGEDVLFSVQFLIACCNIGCGGAAVNVGFKTVREDQYMLSEEDLPYIGNNDDSCATWEDLWSKKDNNAMKKAWLQNYERLANTEEAFLRGLQTSPVVFLNYVTTQYMSYSGGEFSDNNCASVALTHIHLLVGYTETYLKVKGSYGLDWGESGYIRYKRDSQLAECNTFKNAYAIHMTISREIEFAFCNDGKLSTRETCRTSCQEMDTKGISTGWDLATIPTKGYWDEVVDMANTRWPLNDRTDLQNKFKYLWIGWSDPDKTNEIRFVNEHTPYDQVIKWYGSDSKDYAKFGLLNRINSNDKFINSETFEARGVCSRLRTCYDFSSHLQGSGTVAYSVEEGEEMVENTTATITCLDGYEIQGSAQLTCRAGQWAVVEEEWGDDSNLPQCL